MEDIQAKFPDEFSDEPDRKNDQVLHISGEEESKFSEIISYLVDQTYPAGLNREEKSMFQSKVAPYTVIQGVLFRIGANEQLKRCLEKRERKQVMRALHSDLPADTLLPQQLPTGSGQPVIGGRILFGMSKNMSEAVISAKEREHQLSEIIGR